MTELIHRQSRKHQQSTAAAGERCGATQFVAPARAARPHTNAGITPRRDVASALGNHDYQIDSLALLCYNLGKRRSVVVATRSVSLPDQSGQRTGEHRRYVVSRPSAIERASPCGSAHRPRPAYCAGRRLMVPAAWQMPVGWKVVEFE